jgi:hypothetical protein
LVLFLGKGRVWICRLELGRIYRDFLRHKGRKNVTRIFKSANKNSHRKISLTLLNIKAMAFLL